MAVTDQNIKTTLGEDGILLALIDMPGRKMNVFSMEMMDSLERLVIRVEGDAQIRAVVLASGKGAFFAGADLAMVRMFTERARIGTHAELVDLCGRLGRIFRRLERSTKPFVAAVDGLALGGGLELCLACHGRVVSDRRGVLLGLPEIKLGLLPGAGGTQRLPRQIGARRGLEMLLRGDPLEADAALACGMVDEVVPVELLIDRARARARAIADTTKTWDRDAAVVDSGTLALDQAGAHARIAREIVLAPSLLEHYPAYQAIMDCVVQGWSTPMDAALNNEMDIFVRLIQDPVAGNMMRSLFLDRQRSLKAFDDLPAAGAIRIGLSGEDTMGLGKSLAAAGFVLAAPSELSEGDISVTIEVDDARSQTIRIACRREARSAALESGNRLEAGVWTASSPCGRAVEVYSTGDPVVREVALHVARSLRPDAVLVSAGTESVLARLDRVGRKARADGLDEGVQLHTIALSAQEALADGWVSDETLVDSAAVVAGLVPAYSGGPFTFLRQQGEETRGAAEEIVAGREKRGESIGRGAHGA